MNRKEEREQAAWNYINSKNVKSENEQLAFGDFINGAEWADTTLLEKVWDFITANVYKYGKVKFVDDRATFDFRTLLFLYDLKQIVEE